MTFASAIYRGPVVHQRIKPKRHRLRYSVFSLLIDLDELPDLDRNIGLFGYNRFAPLSFHDRDHGPLDGSAIRPWVERRLSDAGLPVDSGPIRLLCYPRVFGYAFNPLSVFFCYGENETLRAILYEVSNTFHERHTYVIPVRSESQVIRQSCDKAMYVSPFIGMDCTYHFRIVAPAERVNIVIRQEDAEGLLLAASFAGKRETLDARSLSAVLLAFPLLTFKIITGIHWEALKLWLKGLKVYPHTPAETAAATSIVEGQSDESVLPRAPGLKRSAS